MCCASRPLRLSRYSGRCGKFGSTVPSGNFALTMNPPLRPSLSGCTANVILSPGLSVRFVQPLRDK